MSSYANSEACKSDIATVCSGSVTEDIETSSLDLNVSHASINVLPSPTSERVVLMTGSILRRSVEFDPSSFTPFQKQASHTLPQTIASDVAATSPPHPLPNQAPDHSTTTRWNDMGPPLSRALLMQSLQSTTGSATGSRAGSVKSYGSNTGASQNSDVVAHVDTDDCGGSLMGSVTDGQSVHSQEDIRSQTEAEPQYHCPGPVSKDDTEKEPNYCDSSSEDGTHPYLKNGASGEHTNGRTSPGGTIYKGKGVRRYQGRYMNLPLQRFRQDNADDADVLDTVLEADKVMEEQSHQQRNGGGYGYDDHWRRSRSQSPPMMIRNNRVRGRSPVRKNGYHDSNANGYHNMPNNHATGRRGVAGYHNNHRSRSRSISPDERRPSTRRKRWNHPGSSSPRDTCQGSNNGNSRRRHHHNNNHHHHHHATGWKRSSDSPQPSRSNSHASESPRRARKRPTSQSRGRV